MVAIQSVGTRGADLWAVTPVSTHLTRCKKQLNALKYIANWYNQKGFHIHVHVNSNWVFWYTFANNRQVLRSNIIGLPYQHVGYLDWKCKDVAIAVGSLILQQLTLIDIMWWNYIITVYVWRLRQHRKIRSQSYCKACDGSMHGWYNLFQIKLYNLYFYI